MSAKQRKPFDGPLARSERLPLYRQVTACAVWAISIIATSFVIAGCEDSPVTPFIPEYVVQGFLIVDEPIGGITVSRSRAVTDSFSARASAVTDAQVEIITGDTSYALVYRSDTALGDYHLPDTSIRVQPATIYRLRVRTTDGTTMTSATLTPDRIEWIRRPADTVTYPVDRQRTPLSEDLRMSWTTTLRASQYIIRQRTLDTINYGIYLNPPTDEQNSVVPDRRFGRSLTRWSLAPATNMILPFSVFRWHGPHEISIYAPEENLLDWFRLTRLQQQVGYDPILANMEGGLGSFGSAAMVRTYVFVRKSQ